MKAVRILIPILLLSSCSKVFRVFDTENPNTNPFIITAHVQELDPGGKLIPASDAKVMVFAQMLDNKTWFLEDRIIMNGDLAVSFNLPEYDFERIEQLLITISKQDYETLVRTVKYPEFKGTKGIKTKTANLGILTLQRLVLK